MATRKFHALLGAAFLFAAAQAQAVTDTERVEVYKEFLAHFNAKKYAEAQPLAEQLVSMTEAQYGAEEMPLITPLTNLATVHYKQGNYPSAIENYQRSLRILQAKSTIGDNQQIIPLHGLGVSFLASGDPESAVIALKRAADLSRNTNGLYNIAQIEFIDALIEAYAASGRYADAEKESLYAMRVEEAAYGRSSVKLLDRLDKLARWYESERRFTSERNIYERALAILARNAPENDLRRIGPLRGIARAFRLEAYYGVEGADGGGSFNAGGSGAPVFYDGSQQRRGESALTTALAIVEANQPADPLLRGAVLVDLGDWYLVSNSMRRAYDTYEQAWKALAEANHTHPIEQPRLLAYRASVSSVDRSQLDPAESVVKVVELRFTVDRDGRVDNVTSPTTDVPENIVRNSVASMRRARYAPRIENGVVVPTNDVVFHERVLVKAPTPAETAPEETTPEEAPQSGTEAEATLPTPPEPPTEAPPPAESETKPE